MSDGGIARRPVIALSLLGLTGCFGLHEAVIRPGAKVRFIEPTDGATVTSPVRVRLDVEHALVRPAGDQTPGLGHHHLVIDREPVPRGSSIPFDANHRHLGGGNADIMVELPPGIHTLTAQFADGAHIAMGVDATIRVTVVTIG